MAEALSQGEIVLSSINEPFSVSLTPLAIVVHADYDGGNPQLGNAYVDIRLYTGEVAQAVTVTLVSKSNDGVVFGDAVYSSDNTSARITIKSVAKDLLEGYGIFSVKYGDDFQTEVRVPFTMVRESTMLDWIQDWNTNKTQIDGSSFITPKIFAGLKKTDGSFSGVFVGNYNSRVGVFGYDKGTQFFKIDKEGGNVGGWVMSANGIYNGGVILNSGEHYIGVGKGVCVLKSEDDKTRIRQNGGLYLHYTSNTDYGMSAYVPQTVVNGVMTHHLIFQLGNTNRIAGWDMDWESLSLGVKKNTAGVFTDNVGDITLGTNGMRGCSWRIENDGTVVFGKGMSIFYSDGSGSFAGGYLKWDKNGSAYFAGEIFAAKGTIGGWSIGTDFLSGGNIIISNTSTYGAIIRQASGKWGLYDDGKAEFASGAVRFDSTGSGIVANGNISWDNSGNITANKIKTESGTIGGWIIGSDDITSGDTNIKLYSKSTGPYISLGNVADGSAQRIKFLGDGSGWIASQNIIWDKSGNITLNAGTNGGNILVKLLDGTTCHLFSVKDNITYISSDRINAYEIITNGLKTNTIDAGKGTFNNITVNGAINSTSGKIGCWVIGETALYKGALKDTALAFTDNITDITFGSNGMRGNTWRFENDGTVVFGKGMSTFFPDGSGSFASGFIQWDKNGSASFEGSITAKNGTIGGWTIGSDRLSGGDIVMFTSSTLGAIIKQSSGKWELFDDGKAVFASGAVRFDSTGSGIVANGNISWDNAGNITANKIKTESGTIGGWIIGADDITSGDLNIKLYSKSSGPYISLGNVTDGSTQRIKLMGDGSGWIASQHIMWNKDGNITLNAGTNGGNILVQLLDGTTCQLFSVKDNITYISSDRINASEIITNGLKAATIDAGKGTFNNITVNGIINSSSGKIGCWVIGETALYKGALKDTALAFTDNLDDITFGANGMRGHTWRFENDGTGALAMGNISWTNDGSLTMKGALHIPATDSGAGNIVIDNPNNDGGGGTTPTPIFNWGDTGPKIKADYIEATDVVTVGLRAKTIDADNATITNLNVTNANVSGVINAASGSMGAMDIKGKLNMVADEGSIEYLWNGDTDYECGLKIDTKASFNAPSSDYLCSVTTRSAVLKVTHPINDRIGLSFRSLYVVGRNEFRGYTEFLRYNSTNTGNAIISEGITNRGGYSGSLVRITTNTFAMDNTQEIALCAQSGALTLMLPASPPVGCRVTVIRIGGEITVTCVYASRISCKGIDKNTDVISNLGEIDEYIFDGTRWFAGWLNP